MTNNLFTKVTRCERSICEWCECLNAKVTIVIGSYECESTVKLQAFAIIRSWRLRSQLYAWWNQIRNSTLSFGDRKLYWIRKWVSELLCISIICKWQFVLLWNQNQILKLHSEIEQKNAYFFWISKSEIDSESFLLTKMGPSKSWFRNL